MLIRTGIDSIVVYRCGAISYLIGLIDSAISVLTRLAMCTDFSLVVTDEVMCVVITSFFSIGFSLCITLTVMTVGIMLLVRNCLFLVPTRKVSVVLANSVAILMIGSDN